MNKILAIVLCIAMPSAVFASDNGYKVTYDGGSIPDTKAGTGMKLFIESNQVRLVREKGDPITVPAAAITEISYGQDVHRRVGGGHRVGGRVARRGRAHGPHQVKETLRRINLGRR